MIEEFITEEEDNDEESKVSVSSYNQSPEPKTDRSSRDAEDVLTFMGPSKR